MVSASRSLERWFIAIRIHTLPVGIAPVVVGSAFAVAYDVFAPLPAFAALLGALLLQIGANLANDVYDAEGGIDHPDSPGFTRVTQSGLLEPRTVKRATHASFGLAFLLGLYLAIVGGLPIVVIGLASILAGYLYAGGPYPLGSHGLGDLFVFVFFGMVAVVGTFYVQLAASSGSDFLLPVALKTIPVPVYLGSIPVGALATGILVVNNVRDLESDRRAGKYTLAVLIGDTASRVQYGLLVAIAYGAVIGIWYYWEQFGTPILLPLVTVPVGAWAVGSLWQASQEARFNTLLKRTVGLLIATATLLGVGLIV